MRRVMQQVLCGDGAPGRRMAIAAAVAAALALGGCAGGGPTPEEQARETAKQEAIEDILTQPLAAEEYAQEERCLSTRAYQEVDVLDDQHVVFRGPGDRIWVNKLRSRCVGLRPHKVLVFDLRASRVCDLDRFEAVDMNALGISSGFCSLGTFQPVTPEQIEAIELAVQEARDS